MSKKYVFTINNYTDNDLMALDCCPNVVCIVAGLETASTGTPHVQGAVIFDKQMRMRAAQAAVGPRSSLKRMGGSWDEQDYCRKEGCVIIDDGEAPISEQGKRNDLTVIQGLLDEGVTIQDISNSHFSAVMRYRRGFEAYLDDKANNVWRTQTTKGVWYFGPTESGKSHMAFIDHGEYHPDRYYLHKVSDGGWWDRYTGQDIVIMNDYRGEIKFNELLTYLDKWPETVRRRGQAPRQFISKLIIFTSSLAPEEVYNDLHQGDDIDQLLRRIEVYKVENRVKQLIDY